MSTRGKERKLVYDRRMQYNTYILYVHACYLTVMDICNANQYHHTVHVYILRASTVHTVYTTLSILQLQLRACVSHY